MQLGSIQRIFPFFHLWSVDQAMQWQPWSTRPDTVEANVIYLPPGTGLPPLNINANFQYTAAATLADIAGDIRNVGCAPCTTEALAIFARPLRYDPVVEAESDVDLDHTDPDAGDPVHAADPADAGPPPSEGYSASDVLVVDHILTAVQQQRLDTRITTILLHLTDLFQGDGADNPAQSALSAMQEALHRVDVPALAMLQASRTLRQTLPADEAERD